jgi:hypothetical protein
MRHQNKEALIDQAADGPDIRPAWRISPAAWILKKTSYPAIPAEEIGLVDAVLAEPRPAQRELRRSANWL